MGDADTQQKERQVR